MLMLKMKIPVLLLLLCGYGSGITAAVKLPRIFTSDMVLQQGVATPIWGWAQKGETITIGFAGKRIVTVAGNDGKWNTKLPVMNYGGPYTLVVRGSNTITLDNILIGEVWVCSGQSNMGLPVESAADAKAVIASADFPQIRLFNVSQTIAQFPQEDLSSGRWVVCDPATVRKFSAAAFFFGIELYRQLKVPIGLINSSVGGTMIERWASPDHMLKDPDFSAKVKKLQSMDLVKEKENRIREITRLNGGFPDGSDDLSGVVPLYAQPGIDDRNWMQITVPAPWHPFFVGAGWSRTRFELTAAEAADSAVLNLGRIDDDDMTFINGKKIGSTMNVGDRRYRIPPGVLKAGTNELAVRIVNRNGTGGIVGGEVYLQTARSRKNLSGLWKFKLSKVFESGLSLQKNDYPSILYNGMIHPLISFAIKGVIWYQGEANTDRSGQYRRLFPGMIRDWRAKWQQGDFPFVFVELPNYNDPGDTTGTAWARLREAQTSACALPNTAMAVAIDIGADNDLHPPNKQDIGKRLAQGALRTAYARPAAMSPVLTEWQPVRGGIKVVFSGCGKGLVVHGDTKTILGFEVAGPDRKFFKATGTVAGDCTVIVRSEKVPHPTAVRYAFANAPGPLNLFSRDGLPVAPFRTDQWP